MVLEQFIIDADIIWDQVGKTFFENPEAKPGRIMRVQVVNAGIIEDLTGYTLNLGWTSVRDPSKFGLDAFDDVDITKGIFEIEYTSGMLTNVGPLNATLQLVPPGEGRPIESNNFKLTVKNSAINPEAIQGETSFKALENALVEVNGWNARIDVVEQEFKDRADALDGAYPVRLTAAEQSVAAVEAQVDLLNRGLGETMPSLALLNSTYPSGDTKDHIVAGNIAEVDTLTVTAISTVAGNITVTLNGVAKTIAVDPAVQTTTALLATLIRSTAFTGWTTGGTGTTVTFTSTTAGARTVPTFSGGTTGVTASIVVTVKGENANFHRYFWNGTAWADGGAYQAIESNDEVKDVRLGYDGFTYPGAGSAVRDQARLLPIVDLSTDYVASSYIQATNPGNVANGATGYRRSSAIEIPDGANNIVLKNWIVNQYVLNVAFYSSVNVLVSTFVGSSSAYQTGEGYTGLIAIPEGATHVVFSCSDTKLLKTYWYRDEIIKGIRTNLSELNAKTSTLTDEVTSHLSKKISPDDTTFVIEKGKNLIDITTLGAPGTWVQSTGIKVNPYVGNTIRPTDYIKVTPNTQYIHDVAFYGFGAFDADKEWINYDETTSNHANQIITTGPTTEWIIINLKDSTAQWTQEILNSMHLIKGIEMLPHTVEIPNLFIDSPVINNLIDLPTRYFAVIGDQLEIFVSGILNCQDYTNYYVQFTTSLVKGYAYKRKWVYTPASGDVDFDLKVTVYDNLGVYLTQKTTKIKIVTKKISIPSPKNILCLGDSLTSSGTWPTELKRRLIATDGAPLGDGLTNLDFIGTALSSGTNFEGYGGWTWNSYLTAGEVMYWVTPSSGMKDSSMQQSIWSDGTNQWTLETIDSSNGKLKFKRTNSAGSYSLASTGTLTWVSGGSVDHANIVFTTSALAAGNPFWNASTGAVDFAYYLNNIGKTSIDYLVVLLGWNTVLGGKSASNVTNGKLFVDKLLAAFPNCKIIISGLQTPSQNGWGANYGTYVDGQWMSNYRTLRNLVHELNVLYEDWCLESAYSSALTFSQLTGQFDMEYGYDHDNKIVNNRSSITEQIQSNCVHPSTNGRLLIADAMYRALESVLN